MAKTIRRIRHDVWRRLLWGSVAVMASGLPLPGNAAVYTGINEHGIRWFSDTQPPVGATYQEILLTVPVPVLPVPASPGQALPKHEPNKADKKKTKSAESTPRKRVLKKPVAAVQASAQERRCRNYDSDLRQIQAQLRAGYRAAQGRKLRWRRQELQARQYAECPIR